MKVTVKRNILSANDAIAADNRVQFDQAGLMAVNLMASPGAGKTSLILATAPRLPEGVRMGARATTSCRRISSAWVKRLPKGDYALKLGHKAEEAIKGAVTGVALEPAQIRSEDEPIPTAAAATAAA